VNTANPSSDIRRLFLNAYDAHFDGTPVFIGEYHSPGHDQVEDLKNVMRIVNDPTTMLTGISFFEYQTRYDKGGAEKGFGMFGLSDDTSIVEADTSFGTFESWCLTPVEATRRRKDDCGLTEKDVDYVSSSTWGFGMDHVATADECCAKCRERKECMSWTWVEDAGLPSGCKSQCWVKGGLPVRKVRKLGVISGLRQSDKKADAQPTAPSYVHEALTEAFVGEGLSTFDICPVPTTTTTSATSATRLAAILDDGDEDEQMIVAMSNMTGQETASDGMPQYPDLEPKPPPGLGQTWDTVRAFWR